MNKTDKKIDLVYLWVDGSDENWAKSKARMISECTDTKLNSDSIDGCRFQDNNELLYSLRSVEKNAPWVNHIYIVTANQKPSWLNLDNKKVTIVNHKTIMDDFSLPNFNSCTIETYLSRIPGLSEYFIYANDDTFFFNKTEPEMFFDENMNPIYQMGKKIMNKPYTHLYGSTIVRAHKLIKDKYGTNIGYFPHHGIDPYRKSYIDECIDAFKDEFFITRHNHFRSYSDIQRVIFAYYAIATKGCRFEIAPFGSYVECRKNNLERLLKSKFPLACINSGRRTTTEDIDMMEKILQEKFPKISSFENNKKTINVCYYGNDNQAEKIYYSMLSILKSKSLNESINVWVIDSGLKEQNQNAFKILENKYDCLVNFIKLKPDNANNELTYQDMQVRACCEILFSNLIKSDRIIYLDNNVNINQSLSELYDSDFEGNYVLSSVNITSKDSFPSVGIVNCGIMLINLGKLRKANLKYNKDISDIITSDKIKYIKNNIKMTTDKNKFTLPFGIFHPSYLKGVMKNIFYQKETKKVLK